MTFPFYLAGRFWRLLLLLTFCVVAIYIVLDFVNQISMWMNRSTEDILDYYLNYIPSIMYLTMPIILMLAVTGVVGGMARHLELAAMKVAGRPILKILAPVWISCFIIALGMYWFNDQVLPDANHKRLELAQPVTKSKKANKRLKVKRQMVLVGEHNNTWYIRQYSAKTKKARGVVVVQILEGQIEKRLDAESLIWKKEGFWLAKEGVIRVMKNGRFEAESFKTRQLKNWPEQKPDDFISSRFSHEEMSGKMLEERIENLRRAGEDTKSWETQWHFKIAGPFMNFIISLIALSLSHHVLRGSLTKNFGIGLLIAFSYYVLVRYGLILGENGALSPWLGAWFGNLVFGAVAMIMTLRSVRL